MNYLKLAFRTLWKTPFVTTIAILSLALGIGANVAIFSVFDQMLLRPLPVSQPERLVNFSAIGPKPGSQSCNQAGDCDVVFSYPMFRDLERAETPFSGIAAHYPFYANVAFRGRATSVEGVEGVLISGSYFPVLGLRPALGRLLAPADDQTPGTNYVTVLSYRYWANQLGADPKVLNQTLLINGQPMTIVGVAPKGFEGTTLGARPNIFVPISMTHVMYPTFYSLEDRRAYWAYLFGRLKPGVTLEAARAGLDRVYHPILNDVEAPLQIGISPKTLAQFRAKRIELEDGRRGQSTMDGQMRSPLALLFATTGIVLLIACANIANLLLARGADRTSELTLRMALGAGRRRLMAQLLAEACLLGIFGGIGSLVVAKSTLGMIAALLPPTTALALRIELSGTAVLFAGGLALVTGVAFGLYPALHSTRPDLVSALSAGSTKHSGTRAAARFRTSLVVAQIAFCMALLISAGLFIESLRNVSRVDLGLTADQVVTFRVSPGLNGYSPSRSATLLTRLGEEVAALPGVTSAASATIPVLSNWSSGGDVAVEGFERTPDTDANSRLSRVSPGYFATLGIPLLAGREFTRADGPSAPQVAIVNETFVKKFNLGRNPVGKRMGHASPDGKETLDIEIVGLVRDSKYNQVKADPQPVYFTPFLQDTTVGMLYFYLRTARDPEAVLRAVPATVARLDPTLPVEELKTLPEQVRENVFLDRLIGMLSAGFAALATLLAAVGLYGVLAYSVTQRTREIGVRMALGADRGRVRTMVLRQVGLMTLIGGVIGIGAALVLGRAAQSLLFGLGSNNPILIAGAAIVLSLVAFSAGWVPAQRASRVDPMHAIRQD